MAPNARRGFTIIELLTAVFVLSVALVGALTLATSNLRNQSMGASRLVAVNLAKEGIELARAQRDTNWLSAQDWDQGLHSQTNKSCAVIESDASLTFRLDAACDGDITNVAFQMYRTSEGAYYQDGTDDTEKMSGMFRKLSFQPICLSGTTENPPQEENTCPSGSNKIGTQVVSEVRWTYGDSASTTKVIEKLYNWK